MGEDSREMDSGGAHRARRVGRVRVKGVAHRRVAAAGGGGSSGRLVVRGRVPARAQDAPRGRHARAVHRRVVRARALQRQQAALVHQRRRRRDGGCAHRTPRASATPAPCLACNSGLGQFSRLSNIQELLIAVLVLAGLPSELTLSPKMTHA